MDGVGSALCVAEPSTDDQPICSHGPHSRRYGSNGPAPRRAANSQPGDWGFLSSCRTMDEFEKAPRPSRVANHGWCCFMNGLRKERGRGWRAVATHACGKNQSGKSAGRVEGCCSTPVDQRHVHSARHGDAVDPAAQHRVERGGIARVATQHKWDTPPLACGTHSAQSQDSIRTAGHRGKVHGVGSALTTVCMAVLLTVEAEDGRFLQRAQPRRRVRIGEEELGQRSRDSEARPVGEGVRRRVLHFGGGRTLRLDVLRPELELLARAGQQAVVRSRGGRVERGGAAVELLAQPGGACIVIDSNGQ